MNTTINLTYNGEKYTLEYDRSTVKLLENAGFVLEEFLRKPANNIELVFSGAFVKHHRSLSQNTIDEIYSKVKDKTGLIQALQKMIQDTYESLLDDPKDGEEGNVTWEVIDLSPKKSQK